MLSWYAEQESVKDAIERNEQESRQAKERKDWETFGNLSIQKDVLEARLANISAQIKSSTFDFDVVSQPIKLYKRVFTLQPNSKTLIVNVVVEWLVPGSAEVTEEVREMVFHQPQRNDYYQHGYGNRRHYEIPPNVTEESLDYKVRQKYRDARLSSSWETNENKN